MIDPVAVEIESALLEERPDLAAYPEAVRAWATAEARCEAYRAYQAEHGVFDADGNMRGGRWVTSVESQAERLRARLGLDPVSEANLRKVQAEAAHTVVDLEAIRARGREALARRRAELTGEGGVA